jgi:hypothetical protein
LIENAGEITRLVCRCALRSVILNILGLPTIDGWWSILADARGKPQRYTLVLCYSHWVLSYTVPFFKSSVTKTCFNMSLSATDKTVREIRTTGPNLSCMARMFRNLSPRDRVKSECVPAPTIYLVVLTCGHKEYRVAHMGYRSCARWGFPAQLSEVPWLLHISGSRTERLRCIADSSITKWNDTYDCPPTCCNSCESDSGRFGVCVLDKLSNMIQGNSDRHWSTQGRKEAKGKKEGKVKCGIKSKILWQRRRHALCKSKSTFAKEKKKNAGILLPSRNYETECETPLSGF